MAGIEGPTSINNVLERYVLDHQWPSWVAKSLNDHLANRILELVWKAETPIPLAELLDKIDSNHSEDVRMVADMLVVRLAVRRGHPALDMGSGGGFSSPPCTRK